MGKKEGVEGVTGGEATGATGGVDSDASPEVQHQKTLIANNHAEYKAAKQRQLMEVQSKLIPKPQIVLVLNVMQITKQPLFYTNLHLILIVQITKSTMFNKEHH